MNMFNGLLRLQWKVSRAWILAAMVVAVGLPVMSVARRWPADPAQLALFLAELDAWSVFYPVSAAVLGLVSAGLVWRADQRGHFVYALTLPVDRRRYVAMRFATGAALIVAVGVVLWVAAIGVSVLVPLPDTLRSYPHALAVKFVLACLVVYALTFALVGLPDRTRGIAARAALVLVAVQVLALILGYGDAWLATAVDALISPWGPLGVLGGRWMLIDV